MERIAREEDRRGRRVNKSYEKLKVKSVWWFWDEEEKVLKDGKDNIRKIKGHGEKGKKL